MSQPITLTLARKAPRPLLWLGVLLVLHPGLNRRLDEEVLAPGGLRSGA